MAKRAPGAIAASPVVLWMEGHGWDLHEDDVKEFGPCVIVTDLRSDRQGWPAVRRYWLDRVDW